MPAIAALNKEANIPPATARTPNRAISVRRVGAIAPNPPKRIAMNLNLQNHITQS